MQKAPDQGDWYQGIGVAYCFSGGDIQYTVAAILLEEQRVHDRRHEVVGRDCVCALAIFSQIFFDLADVALEQGEKWDEVQFVLETIATKTYPRMFWTALMNHSVPDFVAARSDFGRLTGDLDQPKSFEPLAARATRVFVAGPRPRWHPNAR